MAMPDGVWLGVKAFEEADTRSRREAGLAALSGADQGLGRLGNPQFGVQNPGAGMLSGFRQAEHMGANTIAIGSGAPRSFAIGNDAGKIVQGSVAIGPTSEQRSNAAKRAIKKVRWKCFSAYESLKQHIEDWHEEGK